jgi:hypothetical protein
VISTVESQSWMRPARLSGEKPPKTTEWMAPMRALGNHRQVDRDAVALLDAARLQDIAEAADVLVQLGIGDVALNARAVAFENDRGLIGARRQVPVDAVVAGVERAVLEPADLHVAGEACVLNPRIGLDPMQPFALLAPEGVRVAHRFVVHPGIAAFVDPGRLGDCFRNGDDGAH